MAGLVSLDYASRTPIYEQVVNEFERYVALGVLKPKDQIPSIRELAADLGVNPNTIKKSYTELENRGVIMTMSTKGTFIADNTDKVVNNKINKGLQEIKKLINELTKLGITKEEIIERISK